MKKYNFLCVALLGLMFWSCKENTPETPTLSLLEPADNESVDLSIASSVSFSWENVKDISDYQLLLSASENMASPQIIAATTNPVELTTATFSEYLETLSIPTGETTKIYWSIRPVADVEIHTQVRTLNVTRPIENFTISLTEDVRSLLRNPCMGWGLYDDAIQEVQPADSYWSAQGDAANKYASFFYIRWRWSDIEPEEGKYAWLYDENYKKLIKGALDRGLKLCFRIFDNGQDMHHQATPEYVRLAGAEGYTVTGGGKEHWTPYPDDPVFQAKFTKFVEAFAKEYDKPDVVDFIDGFNLGWWGEAHHIVLKDMSKLESVFDFITTLYSSNFKKIILTIPFNNQVGFVTEKRIAYNKKGYAMRRDGLGSQWFTDTEQVYASTMFGKTLLVGESCYWGGSPYFTDDTRYDLKTWRDVFELTYKQAIKSHFNTLDLRELYETEKWTELARDLVVDFTINGGYRLYPTEVSLPEYLKAGKDAVINHSWENTGSGYLPNNLPNWGYKYQTAFALLNDKGETVKIWTDEMAEPSLWLAGKTYSYQLTINTEGVSAGAYRWAVAIVDKTKNNVPGIKLAVADHNPVNGWIILAPVDVK